MILKQCRDHDLPTPKQIEEKPTLPANLHFVFEAFNDLSPSRSYVPSYDAPYENYLSWKDIHDWCCANKLNDIETYEVSYLLKEMDKHYIWYRNKDRSRKR